VADLVDDEQSITHLYRRTIAARKASRALTTGSIELLDGPDGVLAYCRRATGDADRIIVVNFSATPVSVPTELTGDAIVEVASDGSGEAAPFVGELGPEQAMILRCS
jgi:alpha-glucosidase